MTLAQAVDGLYAAFASVPRPMQIVHEPYELEPGEVEQLLTFPLRELSPGLMRSYLFDALYNVGTWDDFRYFLPRLLELMPEQEIELFDIQYRLNYAQQQGMPLSDAQRTALHTYALAYWDDLIADGLMTSKPSIAEMHLDLDTLKAFGAQREELLARWRVHSVGALALAEMLRLNGQVPPEWPLTEVIPWLEAAFFAATNDTEAQLLSDALLMLDGGL